MAPLSSHREALARARARLRWEARTLAAGSPSLTRLLIRNSGYPVRDDTDVVIEGYPRSGNTFAVIAFLDAQPGEVRVAHHVHAPSQVLEAARRGLPAMVLVRPPGEAVPSFAVRLPHLSLRQALRAYVRFHEPLLAIRDRFVTVPFATLRSDFGASIRALNDRFGTRYLPFESTPENVQRCLAIIDRSDRATFGDGEAYIRAVARPTPERDRLAAEARAAYGAPGLAGLRRRAEEAAGALLAGEPA